MVKKKILVAIILLSTVALSTATAVNFEKSFKSISESEWSLLLLLNNDGSFVLQLETWDSGYKNPNTLTKKGTWSKENNKLKLNYDGLIDTLLYVKDISLEELGLTGSAPGLLQESPIDSNSIINGTTLWEEPHDFLIK